MFCSNCGKSVAPSDAVCPHCGVSLGENRFTGSMYTSSQVRLSVEELAQEPSGSLSAFTRTDYMSYDNQPEDDISTNTVYRPLLGEDEELPPEDEEFPPEDGEPSETPLEEPFEDPMNGDAPADHDGADGEPLNGSDKPDEQDESEETDAASEDAPEDIPDDEDEDEVSTSPLPDLPPAAISPAVQRYMRELDEKKQKKAAKMAARGEAHAGTGSLLSRFGLTKKDAEDGESGDEIEPPVDINGYDNGYDEGYDEGYDADGASAEPVEPFEDPADGEAAEVPEDGAPAADTDAAEPYEDEYDEAADDEAASYYEDDGEELETEPAGAKAMLGKALNALRTNRAVQIGLGAVAAAVVLALGIRWLLYVTSSFGAKITGVTHSVYTKGIEMLDADLADETVENTIMTYAINPAYAQEKLDARMTELNGLMPETPQENDQLFITALTSIHRGYQDTVQADATARHEGLEAERADRSAQEWTILKNALAQLKEATSVAQLSALVVDIQAATTPTATPAPQITATPAPTYRTVKQGDMDSADVKRVQQRLIDLHYLSGTADGDFGAMTATAVREFQQAAGLNADGIASIETQEKLFAADAPAKPVAPAPPADTDADTDGDTDAQ